MFWCALGFRNFLFVISFVFWRENIRKLVCINRKKFGHNKPSHKKDQDEKNLPKNREKLSFCAQLLLFLTKIRKELITNKWVSGCLFCIGNSIFHFHCIWKKSNYKNISCCEVHSNLFSMAGVQESPEILIRIVTDHLNNTHFHTRIPIFSCLFVIGREKLPEKIYQKCLKILLVFKKKDPK